jgi:hypothetical protein
MLRTEMRNGTSVFTTQDGGGLFLHVCLCCSAAVRRFGIAQPHTLSKSRSHITNTTWTRLLTQGQGTQGELYLITTPYHVVHGKNTLTVLAALGLSSSGPMFLMTKIRIQTTVRGASRLRFLHHQQGTEPRPTGQGKARPRKEEQNNQVRNMGRVHFRSAAAQVEICGFCWRASCSAPALTGGSGSGRVFYCLHVGNISRRRMIDAGRSPPSSLPSLMIIAPCRAPQETDQYGRVPSHRHTENSLSSLCKRVLIPSFPLQVK